MSKVLVTGANGLLATNVIAELLKKGYFVRGLLRNTDKYKGPQNQKLELVTGDITNPIQMEEVLDNCKFVIHVAALTSQSIPLYATYKAVNVDATESLIQLAIKKGIDKFVFVSSANAFGYGTLEHPGTEEEPFKPPFSRSYYAISKAEAQKKVLGYKNQIPVSVVNPTFMIGPYDGKPGSGKIIMMGHKKRVIFSPPGGKNFINAIDAAQGVVAALEKGKNGQAYLLAGENLTYRDFFQKLSRVEKTHPIIVTIPPLILNAAGYLGNLLRLININTQLSSTNTKMLCINNFYSSAKAKKELEAEFKNIEIGIKSCLEWFMEAGMIDK
jgi:nucleoside-diphosphate-sugar epimerase